MALRSAYDEARGMFEQLKAQIRPVAQNVSGFLQRNPTPAGFVAQRVVPRVQQALPKPTIAPQQYARQNFTPIRQNPIVRQIGGEIKQGIQSGVKRFAPLQAVTAMRGKPVDYSNPMGDLGNIANVGFSAAFPAVTAAYRIGGGAVKGALQAKRTGQPLGKSIEQAIIKQPGFGTAAAGTGPLAMLGNVGELAAPFAGSKASLLSKAKVKGFVFGKNKDTPWSTDESYHLDEIYSDLNKNLNILRNPKSLFEQTKANEIVDIIDQRLKPLIDNHLSNKIVDKLANDYGRNSVGFFQNVIKELHKSVNYYEDKGKIVMGIANPKANVTKGRLYDVDAIRNQANKVLRLGGDELKDIKIIGSTAKGKVNPNDLDILISTKGGKNQAIQSTELYQRKDLEKVFVTELQPYFPGKKLHINLGEVDTKRGPSITLDELASSTPPSTGGEIQEIKRVADNLQRNNQGLGRTDAEAMAKDVISNRPFNKSSSGGEIGGVTGKASSLSNQGGVQQPKTNLQENISTLLPQSTQLRRESSDQSITNYLKELKAEQNKARGSKIGGIKEATGSFLADVKRKIVDSTAPIEDALGAAERKFNFRVLPKDDIRMQIDRSIRAPTLAGQFAKDNGLDQIIRKADDLDALDQYLIAKQASKVTEFGKETGRNLQKDQELIQALGPKYESYAQQIRQYTHKLLDKGVQDGLIDAKLAQELKVKYPDYVPLQRIFGEGELANTPGVTKAVASLSKQTAVQKLTGSKRAIDSPIGSLLAKTQIFFEQGEKNRAAKILASYRQLPGFENMIKEVPTGGGAAHTISYLENGVKKTFSVPQEIEAAAKSLDREQLGILGKILSIPTRVLQLGAVGLNVPFVVTNVAKDQVTAFVNSSKAARTSLINPLNFVRSFVSAVKHDKLYDDLVRSAAGGTSFDIARSQPGLSVAKIRSGKNVASKIGYTARNPAELLRAVENIIGRGEEVTRLQQFRGTYKALLGQGRTPQDARLLAAKAARENTANFQRRGDWGKALNATIPFFNAGIQGARVLVRNAKERPVETGLKLSVGLFMPMAAATTWNLSDPERKKIYDDIDTFEKENNLILIPPGSTMDSKDRYNVIKIPLPPGMSNLTSIVRRSIEAMNGLDPVSIQDIASNLFTAGTSLDVTSPRKFVLGLTPQAVRAPIEGLTNTNLFSGKSIVPDYMKSLPPHEQVRSYTSGTARAVGDKLGVSPMHVENFVRTTAAGVGSQALNLSDRVLAGLGKIPQEQVSGETALENLERRFSKASGGRQLEEAYKAKDIKDATKKEAIRQYLLGDKQKALELKKKNGFTLSPNDIKDYQKGQKTRAYNAYLNGNKDEAKRIVKESNIKLSKQELVKAAKRKAIEYYRLGLKDKTLELKKQYGFVLTRKDVE